MTCSAWDVPTHYPFVTFVQEPAAKCRSRRQPKAHGESRGIPQHQCKLASWCIMFKSLVIIIILVNPSNQHSTSRMQGCPTPIAAYPLLRRLVWALRLCRHDITIKRCTSIRPTPFLPLSCRTTIVKAPVLAHEMSATIKDASEEIRKERPGIRHEARRSCQRQFRCVTLSQFMHFQIKA